MRWVARVNLAFIFMLSIISSVYGFFGFDKCPRIMTLEGATTPCKDCHGLINDGDGYLYHLEFCTAQAAKGYWAASETTGRAIVIGASAGFQPTPCDSPSYTPVGLPFDFKPFKMPAAIRFVATEVTPVPASNFKNPFAPQGGGGGVDLPFKPNFDLCR
ncbi:MAG: hypothetical protein QXO76_01090 [Thermoproteota archaeon]